MIIAAYDVGTTAVKGTLVDERGRLIASFSQPVRTIYEGEHKEQDPQEWYEAFCRISRDFGAIIPGSQVDAVIMSGQMQDVIPVRDDGTSVGNAILYSDGRGEKEARELMECPGKEYLERITGNHYDGSLSLPKILWLKKNRPDIYEDADCFLISAKDYIILRLTGRMAGDVVACSTAGAMDIKEKIWDKKILEAADVSVSRLPRLYYPHEQVGCLTETASRETGFTEKVKVFAGTGDAGATTLASGISRSGEYNINLGTSGWVATVSSGINNVEGGVFNLAYMEQGLYVNVVPFLNAGNVHKWISSLFTFDRTGEKIDYPYISEILEYSRAGSRGVFFLPYLNGERFPVMDTDVRGSFLGITADTVKEDMVRSCLEGVAFSIRQGVESIGLASEKISVIGGGSRVGIWNQILADVLNQKIIVYKNAEILPALALSASVLLAEGKIEKYSDFTDMLQDEDHCEIYEPDESSVKLYETQYKKYLTIYSALREFYRK